MTDIKPEEARQDLSDPARPRSVYDFRLPALGRGIHNLADWRGKPILIVNTASQCGFTKQYGALQRLWHELRESGLVILGVPSNDFGQQEPGNAKDIRNFCEVHYGVSFPLAEKSHVTGPEAIPLFRFLDHEGGFLSRPRWNFYKYLTNRQGHLAEWYTPLTSPQSPRLIRAIEEML